MNRIQILTQTFKNLKLSSGYAVKVSSQEKRIRLPPGYNKPKPYSLFVKDNYKDGNHVTKEAPRIAKLWKDLSEDVKKEYTAKAEKIGEKRLTEFNNLSEFDRENKLMKSKENIEKRRKNRFKSLMKAFKKETNYPERPLNAFTIYIKEYLKSKPLSNREQSQAVFSEGCKSWKNLPDSVKQSYIDIAKQNFAKHKEKVKKWRKINDKKYKELRQLHTQQKVSKKSGLYSSLKARSLRKKTPRGLMKKRGKLTRS